MAVPQRMPMTANTRLPVAVELRPVSNLLPKMDHQASPIERKALRAAVRLVFMILCGQY